MGRDHGLIVKPSRRLAGWSGVQHRGGWPVSWVPKHIAFQPCRPCRAPCYGFLGSSLASNPGRHRLVLSPLSLSDFRNHLKATLPQAPASLQAHHSNSSSSSSKRGSRLRHLPCSFQLWQSLLALELPAAWQQLLLQPPWQQRGHTTAPRWPCYPYSCPAFFEPLPCLACCTCA